MVMYSMLCCIDSLQHGTITASRHIDSIHRLLLNVFVVWYMLVGVLLVVGLRRLPIDAETRRLAVVVGVLAMLLGLMLYVMGNLPTDRLVPTFRLVGYVVAPDVMALVLVGCGLPGGVGLARIYYWGVGGRPACGYSNFCNTKWLGTK